METLSVSTDLSRRDLFLVNLRLLLRLRSNWITMGVLAAGSFVYSIYDMDEVSAPVVLMVALISAVGAFAILLCVFLVGLIFFSLTLPKNGGVFGRHDYSMTPAGFLERTPVNESHHAWGGIAWVKRVRGYLLISVHSHLLHVVPRRAFDSDADFESFAQHAEAWCAEAHAQLRLQRS